MNKATCLSLLSNAVLVWNTHHIGQTVQALRAQGCPVDDNDLARISPLAFRNIEGGNRGSWVRRESHAWFYGGRELATASGYPTT